MVFLDSLGPSDVAGHQDEGNNLFRGSHYEDAAFSYGRALQALFNSSVSKGLIISLLLNSSACHLALQQPSMSLKLAFTAAVLDSTNSKAFYRTALALDALQLHGAANWSMQQAAAVGNTGSNSGSSVHANEMMKKLSPAAIAATATADKALSAICGALLTPDAEWLSPVTDSVGVDSSCSNSRNVSCSAVGTNASSVSNQSGSGGVESAVAEADAASVIKDKGNTLFKNGSFADALSLYTAALSTLQQDSKQAAILLNNRATCHLRLGNLPFAVQDSSAALLLDSTQPKGYHRLGSALMQMGRLGDALACIDAGLVVAPGNEGLAVLQQRITIAVSASSTKKSKSSGSGSSPSIGGSGSSPNNSGSGSSSGGSSRTQANPAKAAQPKEEPKTSGDAMTRMNEMMGMMDSMPGFNREEARKIGLPETGSLDKRVPPFHTEFSMEGMWPAQCDIPKSREFLLLVYENARGMPIQEMMVMSTELKDEVPEYVMQVSQQSVFSAG